VRPVGIVTKPARTTKVSLFVLRVFEVSSSFWSCNYVVVPMLLHQRRDLTVKRKEQSESQGRTAVSVDTP
jgi:hypothetical protein